MAYFAHYLWSFHYLPGADAYYYALQAQSLLDHGQLKVPDHDAVHYITAALARGALSMENAFRAAITVIFTFYQLGMLLLVLRSRTKSQVMAALVWAFSSPMVAFHAIEFPNLTLGIAPLPVCFWLAMRPVSRWMGWLAVLLSISILAHPASAALAGLFVAAITLDRTMTGTIPWEKRSVKVLAWTLGAVVVVVIAAVVIYMVIKRGLLSSSPGMPGIVGLAITADLPNEMRLTVLSVWLLLAILLISCWKKCSIQWKSLAVAALAMPLWPNPSLGLAGLGGRLSVLFVLLALPLITRIFSEVAKSHTFSPAPVAVGSRAAWIQRACALSAVIAIVFLPVRLQAYRALLMSDDYASYERVVAGLRRARIPMLIAHRGLDFFYSYRLKRDAFHFDPEHDWNQLEIWRIAARITPEEMAYYLPPTCPWGQIARVISGTDYILVREDCWEQFRSRLNRNDNPDLYTEGWENPENPSQMRPQFLRERHRDSASPIVTVR